MKLTPDYIESQVVDTKYQVDGTFTICTITTKAGIKLVGTSGCLDPKNYVEEVGESIARRNAVEQIWALEGYFVAKLEAKFRSCAEKGEPVLFLRDNLES